MENKQNSEWKSMRYQTLSSEECQKPFIIKIRFIQPPLSNNRLIDIRSFIDDKATKVGVSLKMDEFNEIIKNIRDPKQLDKIYNNREVHLKCNGESGFVIRVVNRSKDDSKKCRFITISKKQGEELLDIANLLNLIFNSEEAAERFSK